MTKVVVHETVQKVAIAPGRTVLVAEPTGAIVETGGRLIRVTEHVRTQILRTPGDAVVVSAPETRVIEVGIPGLQGPPGSGAGPGGSQTLFVQPTNPGMTEPGLWIDTTGGNLSFWVEVP